MWCWSLLCVTWICQRVQPWRCDSDVFTQSDLCTGLLCSGLRFSSCSGSEREVQVFSFGWIHPSVCDVCLIWTLLVSWTQIISFSIWLFHKSESFVFSTNLTGCLAVAAASKSKLTISESWSHWLIHDLFASLWESCPSLISSQTGNNSCCEGQTWTRNLERFQGFHISRNVQSKKIQRLTLGLRVQVHDWRLREGRWTVYSSAWSRWLCSVSWTEICKNKYDLINNSWIF